MHKHCKYSKIKVKVKIGRRNVLDRLNEILSKEKILLNELMKDHTTFHIGGPADIMVLPETEEELIRTIRLCNELGKAFFILGGGSNILVPDEGLREVVIKLAENYSKWKIDGTSVEAESGIKLTALSDRILDAELTGFEFASGIPGTVGGGVYMNAGAYDGEMKQIVRTVRVIDRLGNVREYSNEEMEFGYRHSKAMTRGDIISKVVFELQRGHRAEIKARIDDLTEKRTSKQPLAEFSAGSTFKRPTGYFAGKLIQDAGLKGFSIGEAKVSEKHSGFVINKGNCSYRDMVAFIEEIKRRVYEDSGVMLEEEVRILGEK